jgi:Holliday junction resolvase RusA-like endonuclease
MYKEITLYFEKSISWNTFYSAKHWFMRKKKKDEWNEYVRGKMGEFDVINFDTFGIKMFHNTRMDTDNLCMQKFILDFMKENGWCKDDNKKYFKSFSCEVDDELPKGMTKITIFGYEIN